jgi:Domain of unknown function (DUF929)
MVGSGADDGDIIEMSMERPRRAWAIGRRSRLILIVAGACALLAVGGTLAAVRLTAGGPADPALEKLITEVTTVPVGAAVAVGSGGIAPPVYIYGSAGYATESSAGGNSYSSTFSAAFPARTPVNGPPLVAGGKPEVLYIATEYCPYCVAENWALIVALSRFGQFSGLSTSRSPYFENVPPIDGWTFYGSSYASPYLAFMPVESRSNILVSPKADPGNGESYRVLQHLTRAQQAILDRLDKARQTPFVDLGGKATIIGAGVSTDALAGKTWSQIAVDLRQPRTQAGYAIVAAADALTTEFCRLTGNRPAVACRK